MDYEQKYKAALERAKQMHQFSSDIAEIKRMEQVFPELADSEDEKVKRIIHSISNKISFHLHDIFTEEEFQCFDAWSNAWLEKQGQVNETIIPQHEDKTCKENNDSLTSEDERIRKSIIAIINNYVDNSNTFKPKMLAWLEKQGESKYIPKYKIGDYVKNTNYKGEPIYEIIYMDKECYICEYRGKERMGDKAVMHFSFDNPYLCLVQKSDDKVEPKFKKK